MLRVSVRKSFRSFRLDAAFDAPGGVTALFGPSGSGKTTLLDMVAGLTAPDDGVISFDGETWFDKARGVNLPAHLRRVGYVFQDARLFPHLDVRGNLDYGRRMNKRVDDAAEFARVVALLGLESLLARAPLTLSGGEAQRVAIGRALLSGPRLMLLDEPLASLDEARKNEILPWLDRLRAEVKLPMLYVSHSAAEVARIADRVIDIGDGRATPRV